MVENGKRYGRNPLLEELAGHRFLYVLSCCDSNGGNYFGEFTPEFKKDAYNKTFVNYTGDCIYVPEDAPSVQELLKHYISAKSLRVTEKLSFNTDGRYLDVDERVRELLRDMPKSKADAESKALQY